MPLGVAKDFSFLPTSVLWQYSAGDADGTWRIQKALRERVKHLKLMSYLDHPTMELSQNLLKAELLGYKMSRPKIQQTHTQVDKCISLLSKRVLKESGRTNFNPNSPIQLREVLFDELKLEPSDEVTPTGAVSTGKAALTKMFEDPSNRKHPILKNLLRLRALEKLRSTYIIGFSDWLDEADYLHTTFVLGGAVSGRVTSREPALTTVPRDRSYSFGKDKEILVSLRSMFICEDNEFLLHTDYSQIELRLVAFFAHDDVLISVFDKGGDPHDETSRAVFSEEYVSSAQAQCLKAITRKDGSTQVCENCKGCAAAAKRDDQRNDAKRVNFGIVYGSGAQNLADTLNVSITRCKAILDKFYNHYKGLRDFMWAVPQLAMEQGYLQTPFGRYRRFPKIDPNDPTQAYRIGELGRQAVNFLPQATAAEITYRSLNLISRKFTKYRMKSWPRNIVYDAVDIVGPKKEERDATDIVMEVMGRKHDFLEGRSIPFTIGVGRSWADSELNKKKVV